MNVHEYQAKDLLSKAGVPTLPRRLVRTPAEARRAFEELALPAAAVKAQIQAGGRGKAGGIRIVKSAGDAERAAAEILGKRLVTPQTGPQGKLVRMLLVEAGCRIQREFYAGVTLDRKAGAPVLLLSTEGGVEIEVVAARNPAAILREVCDPVAGLAPFQARRAAFRLGLTGDAFKTGVSLLAALARAAIDLDASLVEINPLALTAEGGLVALDAKLNLDDRAVEARPELAALRDPDEENPREREAHEAGLSYVSMEGNIGCLVNGAGLAMSTMDIIQLAGGRPANFLDVGGGASRQQVTTAFKLLVANPDLKAILVNIFGGILQCDVVAQGIVEAVREVGVRVPVVVRLEGTNVEPGRGILKESGLAVVPAADMADAARKVVEAAGR